MLAASRARAGRACLAARRVDTVELARGVVRSFEGAARRAQVAIGLSAAEGTTWCHADPDLLTQALANLVSNALKFTRPGGRVDVEVGRRAEGRGETLVELAVRDTGHGLSCEEIERILSGDGTGPLPARAQGGLGLGLAIVRAIVEQHGGRLEIEGEPGAGSCFRLVLPVDFLRSEQWRLAQVAEGIRLAHAVGAPLTLVEIGLLQADRALLPWTTGPALGHLSLLEQCLEGNLRPNDTVVVGESSASLVLYGADATGASRVAARAAEALQRLLDGLPGPFPRCTVGVGVGSYPADGATAEEVVEAARRRMGTHRASPVASCERASRAPAGEAMAGAWAAGSEGHPEAEGGPER
jgi:hypothetical protein